VDIALSAAPGVVPILPGEATRVWRFTGRLLKGPADALRATLDSYLGPTIRVRRGQNVRIRFANGLDEPSIVHWHGLDVPSAMDGHPHRVIPGGAEYLYEFTVRNRAGTYWYHPHPHGRTGPQVYRGLAGLFVVTDDEEAALGLPADDGELACVLQDRRFDDGNQLSYLDAAPGMMNAMHGFLGEHVLVNGRLQPSFDVATRAYRLRILNGSNARIYRLAWSDDTPITVIGIDGGLLDRPLRKASVTLAPAQRVDLVVDLSSRRTGTDLRLISAPFPATDVDTMAAEMGRGAGMGMGRGRGRGAMAAPPGTVPNGAALSLLTLRITRSVREPFRLPDRLSQIPATGRPDAAVVRRIPLTFQAGQWLIDGRTFDMMDTTVDERVAAGSTHVWEFANTGGMMSMQMAHPMHLHGPQFRVIGRTGGTPSRSILNDGFIDTGWTDTTLVLPGQTVRIQVTFTRHPGLYLYHCHLLEHEDMGMMRNFLVT
jgi:FtsP/CotA-like multicopper oxidase with cupredoxin domain